MKSLLVISVLCVCLIQSAFADSLTVVFHYSDPARTAVRAYLPADFNNWGPNNGGVIDSNASCRMQYNAGVGGWIKSYRLKAGSTYYYKFHLHLNQSGSQSTWIPDPANTRTDGSSYGNSVVTVSDPMIFEPSRTISVSAVTKLTAAVFGSRGIARIVVVLGGDSIIATDSLSRSTGFFSWTPPGGSVSVNETMSLTAFDSAGVGTYLGFWQAPPPPGYTVPEWSRHAVWYQIFPERFRNADPANDPLRSSLENWQSQPVGWRITPWTADWYSRDSWETGASSDFYSTVFNRRLGGDLQGVRDKLGYLDSLGVNSIYLNPVFYARSLHKYDGRAHHHIDPYFGPDPAGDIALMGSESLSPASWRWTSADTLFLGLLRDAHARGMHVIIDGVFNHTGVDFPAFQDIVLHQQSSPFADWYIVTAWDNPATPQNEFAYHGWWGYSGLPEFADTPDGTNVAPGPKQYIYDITKRWMDPNGDGDPSDGIDGWRLDTVPDVPLNFWTDWNTYVRSLNPDAYTTSETWGEASATVRDGRFSATMNYGACAIPIYNFLIKGSSTASSFAADITAAVSAYGDASAQANQNLIDSHDTERLASMIVNAGISTGYHTVNNPRASAAYSIRKPGSSQRSIQKLTALIQAAIPGSPMIYYGDEAGMWGGNDPDDRQPMPWPDMRMDLQTRDPRGGAHAPDDPNVDSALVAYYSNVLKTHSSIPALQTGNFAPVYANDSWCTLVFERHDGSDKALVAVNNDALAHSIRFPVTGLLQAGQSASVALTSESGTSAVTVNRDDTTMTIYLPPETGAILRVDVPGATSLRIDPGWSMISVPRAGVDTLASALVPHAVSQVFKFTESGYQAISSLTPGVGYWVKHGSSDTLKAKGAGIYTLSIPVRAGWNLIGTISTDIPSSAVSSNPPNLIMSPFYSFSGGYASASVLRPGKGYWVKVASPGLLLLK